MRLAPCLRLVSPWHEDRDAARKRKSKSVKASFLRRNIYTSHDNELVPARRRSCVRRLCARVDRFWLWPGLDVADAAFHEHQRGGSDFYCLFAPRDDHHFHSPCPRL